MASTTAEQTRIATETPMAEAAPAFVTETAPAVDKAEVLARYLGTFTEAERHIIGAYEGLGADDQDLIIVSFKDIDVLEASGSQGIAVDLLADLINSMI